MVTCLLTPKNKSRSGRRNRRNNSNSRPQVVEIASLMRQMKIDNILNFAVRYQQQSSGSPQRSITRAFLLSTLLMNSGGGTTNYRLCAAVRVNKVRLYTAITASIEWLSAYGPTSATIITAQSATAAAELIQRPSKNSLASFWSMIGSNESEVVMKLQVSQNDYIDVNFSVVLLDQESASAVTTSGTGTTGQIYRSFLDGPDASAKYVPIYAVSLN
jgi:hypothetical protein